VINGTAAGPDKAGDTYNYLSHVVSIEAGQNYAVAIRSNGLIYTWGMNTTGQMGNGYTASYQAQPVAVRAQSGKTDASDAVTTRVQSFLNGQKGTYHQTTEFFQSAAAAAAGRGLF